MPTDRSVAAVVRLLALLATACSAADPAPGDSAVDWTAIVFQEVASGEAPAEQTADPDCAVLETRLASSADEISAIYAEVASDVAAPVAEDWETYTMLASWVPWCSSGNRPLEVTEIRRKGDALEADVTMHLQSFSTPSFSRPYIVVRFDLKGLTTVTGTFTVDADTGR